MSGTASNYDVPRMIIGVTLSALSFITLCFDIYRSPRLFNVDSLIFITAVMCYAVMMFASSYVEEEQHFWYWISAGWIAYLHVQR
jgi:ethanolaminephosphotransferase